MATHFERIDPILCVADMAASIDYYVRVLGFKRADWSYDDFGCVMRDDGHIYLSANGQGRPGAWIWVGVEDVRALYEEYTAAGAKIVMPPTNYPWALEMRVADLDGNILRIGSDPE